MTVIQRKRLGHGTVAITDLVDGRSTYERLDQCPLSFGTAP